jgi:hypothetical protein
VLEAVFVLLEFSSPSRRIFIGSHSLPPSLVRRIGPSVVETCQYLIGKENGELNQEVKWLRERFANLMGKGKSDEEQMDISQDMKSKVQPSQDNRDPMVKKLEKGATVTCYKCHEEGHKFYKCPQFVKKMDKGATKKLKPTIKSSLIYTKPNRKNKTNSNTYVIK